MIPERALALLCALKKGNSQSRKSRGLLEKENLYILLEIETTATPVVEERGRNIGKGDAKPIYFFVSLENPFTACLYYRRIGIAIRIDASGRMYVSCVPSAGLESAD